MNGNNQATPRPLLDSMEAVREFEQTPLAERFPLDSAYQLIQDAAQRFGDDPALECLLTGARDESPQTISYRELAAAVTRAANLFGSLGLGREDAVSIILPTLPQSHPAILGAQTAGIANPINPLLDPAQIAEIITAARSRIIVCLAPSDYSDIWDKIQQLVGETSSVRHILVVRYPGLTREQELPAQIGDGITIHDYNTLLTKEPAVHLRDQGESDPARIAAYFHTGGTTGRPKIACLTQANMAFIGQLMQVLTAHLGRQTVICGLPLFHIFGVVIQGIAAFAVGYRIVLLTPSGFRNPEGMKNLWHHVERFRVNSFSAVPTVLAGLSRIPVGSADISSLERINSGAAPLSPNFEKQFEQTYKLDVTNGYGMTETTSLIARPPEEQPPGSVGLRLPYSRIRIAEIAQDKVLRDCVSGETGAVLVRGPQVFAGYKAETDNRHAFVENDWFNTGDLGYLDDDGFLYLTGRAKDLIIRSGHNIDPAVIEEVLNGHPQVTTAVAVGEPDPYAGELPMAFVVATGEAVVDAETLITYCREHLSERAAVPKRIEFVEAMPLTAVGKIFRPALRQQITRMILNEQLQESGIRASIEVSQDNKLGMVVRYTAEDEAAAAATETMLSHYSNITLQK